MKANFCLTIMAAVLLAMVSFSVSASAPGWYIQGEAGYSELSDADTARETDPSVNPGTPPSPGTGQTCFLNVPGLLCLLPSPGTPPGGGTPPSVNPGTQQNFTLGFDGGWAGGAAIGYAWENGLRSELELRHSTNDVSGADASMDATALMANLWLDFNPEGDWHPYVGAGLGAAKVELDGGTGSDDTVVAYQLGLGLEYDLSRTLALGLGYRYFGTDDPEFSDDQFTVKSEYQQHLGLLTLRYTFAPSKPPDSDADGVPDPLDKCPNTAPGIAVNADGCPRDMDGDGVPAYLDKCPGTPAGVPVDDSGCPLDSDGDGVPDYKDQCPNTPAGVRVDATGCPLVVDADGDGVPDDMDKCPNTPAGMPVLTNGCAKGQATELDGVHFKFDSAELTRNAREILLETVRVLKDSPGFRVKVAGHTDSIGSAAYNLRLSKARADSVKAFLVRHGIQASRLETRGYGETRPIAPNNKPDGSDNPEGRAKNRRVMLVVLGN